MMRAASSGRTPSRPSRWWWYRSTPRNRNVSEKPPNASMPSSLPRESTCCSTIATSVPASSSRTRSSSAFRTAWWSAIAAWRKACSSTGIGARKLPKNSPSRTPSGSSAGGSQANYATMRRVLLLLALLPLAAQSAPQPEAQREPEIKAAVQHAIDQAECFEDRYDSAVWYKMMEPRLRKRVPDREERMAILKHVFCEANRPGEARIPPGLVMAIIDIESGFNRYAVSHAGAVGLMQVMPFWPETLGMRRHQLIRAPENIRMGCAIFRAYLKRENHNIARALARYNGSVGKRWYSDKVINQWTRWNGADDLGKTAERHAELKPTGG